VTAVGQVLRLTLMLLRAYSRDFSALFFGFAFPLMFMLIFGALNFGTFRVSLGVADEARNPDSARFIEALRGVSSFQVSTGSSLELQALLEKGDRDLVVLIPQDFRIAPAPAGARVPAITVVESRGAAQEASIGKAVLASLIDQLSFAVTNTQPVVTIQSKVVSAAQLRYVDFLTPGIIGMTIMQIGISSVAFGFVSDKQRGVLRRIMATPISRRRFLAANVLQRVLLAMLQVMILLAVGVFVFGVQVVGSVAALLAVAALGCVTFLCMGFALAGWCTTENQVPPLTQILTLPQLFLSSVFFARDAVPAVVRPIADVLPLTFLNHAMREISTGGATLAQVGGDLVGLSLWTIVGFAAAVKLFRLESS